MENRAEMNEKVEKGRRHKSEQTVTAVSGRRRAVFMAMTGLRLNHSAALRQERLCCRHDPCHTLGGEGRCPVRRPAPPAPGNGAARPTARQRPAGCNHSSSGGGRGQAGTFRVSPSLPQRTSRAVAASAARVRGEQNRAKPGSARPVPSRQRLLVGGAISRRLGGESEVGSWGGGNGERLVGLGV